MSIAAVCEEDVVGFWWNEEAIILFCQSPNVVGLIGAVRTGTDCLVYEWRVSRCGVGIKIGHSTLPGHGIFAGVECGDDFGVGVAVAAGVVVAALPSYVVRCIAFSLFVVDLERVDSLDAAETHVDAASCIGHAGEVGVVKANRPLSENNMT